MATWYLVTCIRPDGMPWYWGNTKDGDGLVPYVDRAKLYATRSDAHAALRALMERDRITLHHDPRVEELER